MKVFVIINATVCQASYWSSFQALSLAAYLEWTIQTNLPGIVLPSAHCGNMWGISETGKCLKYFTVVETKEKNLFISDSEQKELFLSQCPLCKQAQHQKWNNQFEANNEKGRFSTLSTIFWTLLNINHSFPSTLLMLAAHIVVGNTWPCIPIYVTTTLHSTQ